MDHWLYWMHILVEQWKHIPSLEYKRFLLGKRGFILKLIAINFIGLYDFYIKILRRIFFIKQQFSKQWYEVNNVKRKPRK